MEQTYNIRETYRFNYERGPCFSSSQEGPVASSGVPSKEFMGLRVQSRLGIAAGLLLNSKWVLGYARRGFDILTYKTVRSSYRPCYDLPNWVFVEENGAGPAYALEAPPEDVAQVSSSVCFGMPSMEPEIWREDVRRAKSGLGEGQILIVSVVATPVEGASAGEVAADFRRCAEWAVQSGADAIEANFSCPNVCSSEGTIYQDASLTHFIAREIRAGIGTTPLLIKSGHLSGEEALGAFLHAVDGVANGVTMVNCLIRPVLHRDGRPVFGQPFRYAGVLGRGIHKQCVEDVRRAAGVIRRDQLNLSIAAVGGASTERDVVDFFEVGADAVLLGSAPMYRPDLAVELRRAHPEW